MLTLLEEVVLLTIDPRTGRLRGDTKYGVPYALAGAALFDLALAGRIDTDVTSITVVSDAPTGNRIQDELLDGLSKDREPRRVRDCVERIFLLQPDLEREVLAQLVDRGIIRQEKTKLLWVIDRARFPLVDGKPQQSVSARLAQAVLEDHIPDVRDIMLVSLANACGLLGVVLAPSQIEARAEWIETLSGIETISRTVGAAIADLLRDVARGPNFGSVTFLSSAGVRMLLMAAKRCRRQSVKLALHSVVPPVANVFKLSGLDPLLPTYDSREAALEAIR